MASDPLSVAVSGPFPDLHSGPFPDLHSIPLSELLSIPLSEEMQIVWDSTIADLQKDLDRANHSVKIIDSPIMTYAKKAKQWDYELEQYYKAIGDLKRDLINRGKRG
jgi:hypothetical protein